LGSSQRVIVKSDADPGESYYKSGSTWHDLYDYSFSNPTWDESANFCIKAMTGEYTPLIPDLDVELLEIFWEDITPGEEATGEFAVKNIGDPNSLLDWEVTEWPEWGDWIFTPFSGSNLKPEDGEFIVGITVTAPEEENTDFTGEIKIVNKENPDDYDTISITLKTPRIKVVQRPLLNFLQNHPNAFPIMQQLPGL